MNVKLLIVVGLALFAFVQFRRVSETIGADFYLVWGVSAALKVSGHELGSPYTDGRYAAVLAEYAEESEDAKLQAAGSRRRLKLSGTPLLYLLFAPFPEHYTSALALFRVIQASLYLSALVLLGALYQYEKFVIACLAALTMAFDPIVSDLLVGNINSIQLFGLASVLAISESLLGRGRHTVKIGALFLTILSFLTLLKPNFALIAVVMALHFLVRHGARAFVGSAVGSLAVSAIFVFMPCVYFRSWSIWIDWYQRITRGSGISRFANPVSLGNFSGVTMIAEWLDVAVFRVTAAVAFLLAASLVVVILRWCRSVGQSQTWPGNLCTELVQVFDDPRLTMTIGVVASLAVSPLAWSHYYVLALVPGLWLMNSAPSVSGPGILAVISIVMSSGAPRLFFPYGQSAAGVVAVAFSWIPLWSSMLLHLWRRGDTDSGAIQEGES